MLGGPDGWAGARNSFFTLLAPGVPFTDYYLYSSDALITNMLTSVQNRRRRIAGISHDRVRKKIVENNFFIKITMFS